MTGGLWPQVAPAVANAATPHLSPPSHHASTLHVLMGSVNVAKQRTLASEVNESGGSLVSCRWRAVPPCVAALAAADPANLVWTGCRAAAVCARATLRPLCVLAVTLAAGAMAPGLVLHRSWLLQLAAHW